MKGNPYYKDSLDKLINPASVIKAKRFMTVKDCGVILVTTNSEEEAKNIARILVSEKLAACVNIFPIHSIYRWQGEVCEDREWQLVIKTNLKLFPQLAEKIKSLHSYQTPEIIALPLVDGSQSYIEWLQDSVIHL